MSYESEPKRKFDNGELTMENEPKGPYKLKDGIKVDGNDFIYVESEIEVEIANAAHAEGYRAGRASRDGLREEIKRLQSVVGQVDYDLIEEALAEDEKEGK